MLLVPSLFEPCGLTQMVAMRYGTIPVVRRTGGLNDTVFDVLEDVDRAKTLGMEPNGFSFKGSDTASLDSALDRAISLWYEDKKAWAELAKTGMRQDWSWDEPAADYVSLYRKAQLLSLSKNSSNNK